MLRQRAKETKAKMEKKLEDLTNRKAYHEECLKTVKRHREEELKYIESEFDMLISHLVERKTFFETRFRRNQSM